MYDSSNRVFGVGLVGVCACMIHPTVCGGEGVCVSIRAITYSLIWIRVTGFFSNSRLRRV